MTNIGMMQGRLVPPEEGQLQAFPREQWVEEISLAGTVPLAYLEWIYEASGEEWNPLKTASGTQHLLNLSAQCNLMPRAICADWFMDFPLACTDESERRRRVAMLCFLLMRAEEAGVQRLVLPFVDASRIGSLLEQDLVVRSIEEALPAAEAHAVELHLETSLDPQSFARLLGRLPHPRIKVNYDSGNSASLGYSVLEEFAAYGTRIGSVHIKDRVPGGGSVALGTGAADFHALFRGLQSICYTGDFTLQTARGAPGGEVQLARENLTFLSSHLALTGQANKTSEAA